MGKPNLFLERTPKKPASETKDDEVCGPVTLTEIRPDVFELSGGSDYDPDATKVPEIKVVRDASLDRYPEVTP